MVSLMHRKAPSLDGTLMTWCRDLKEVPMVRAGAAKMESDSQYLTIDLQDMYRILYFYGGVY